MGIGKSGVVKVEQNRGTYEVTCIGVFSRARNFFDKAQAERYARRLRKLLLNPATEQTAHDLHYNGVQVLHGDIELYPPTGE